MKKDVTTNNIAEQVTKLPSVQNEALAEIIKGLYQGKPLLGPSGLLTSLVKDLTQIALQFAGNLSYSHFSRYCFNCYFCFFFCAIFFNLFFHFLLLFLGDIIPTFLYFLV